LESNNYIKFGGLKLHSLTVFFYLLITILFKKSFPKFQSQ